MRVEGRGRVEGEGMGQEGRRSDGREGGEGRGG